MFCKKGTILKWGQLGEQHGFRTQGRMEEHLLTTNLELNNTLALDVLMWIASLDLSKAFDKAKWKLMESHGRTENVR